MTVVRRIHIGFWIGILIFQGFLEAGHASESASSRSAQGESNNARDKCGGGCYEIQETYPITLGPIAELGPRSRQIGLRGGILSFERSELDSYRGIFQGPSIQISSLLDDKVRAYEVFLHYGFGAEGIHIWPTLTFEFGWGFLLDGRQDDEIPDKTDGTKDRMNMTLVSLGLIFGSPKDLQIGVLSRLPVSGSNKPSWFADWSVAIRYQFDMGEHKEKDLLYRILERQ